jgi:hypothetical protein
MRILMTIQVRLHQSLIQSLIIRMEAEFWETFTQIRDRKIRMERILSLQINQESATRTHYLMMKKRNVRKSKKAQSSIRMDNSIPKITTEGIAKIKIRRHLTGAILFSS